MGDTPPRTRLMPAWHAAVREQARTQPALRAEIGQALGWNSIEVNELLNGEIEMSPWSSASPARRPRKNRSGWRGDDGRSSRMWPKILMTQAQRTAAIAKVGGGKGNPAIPRAVRPGPLVIAPPGR